MAAKPTVLIMAAGHGTRMKSDLPKVLHPVCGRPMVEWTIAAAQDAGAEKVVCIVRPGEGVAEHLPDGVGIAEQTEGEGTGSAVLAAREHAPEGTVVVLSGDHPLISAETIAQVVATHEREQAAATLLTTEDLDPDGYGRIVRDAGGSVERIVETKHTEGVDPTHLAIREINIGTYAFDAARLFEILGGVGEERGERYLTTVFEVLRERGERIAAHRTHDVLASMGVNTRADLMDAAREAQRRILRAHAENGVTFPHPESVAVEHGVAIGPDTVIDANTVLRAGTEVGARCTIRSSFLDQARVGDDASVGPFAYLRPGADIGAGAKIGTFVEIKNSVIGPGTKVPHLSYLGDADVGEGSNIAAGNITANYDGRAKHRTVIGNRVKTSVDTSFVAPVHVGDDAYTGAGSVITEDIPPGALGIARARQRNVEDYAQRVNKERAEDEQQP